MCDWGNCFRLGDWSYFWSLFCVEAVTKKAYPHLHTTADSTVSKRDISSRYIDPKETAFDWDISDLGGLKFATYDDKGDAMSIVKRS